jgi:Cellulase (glycosyl hydrolase family 5)
MFERRISTLLATGALLACGDPPVVVVAHDRAAARDRPHVENGTIVSDAGSLLHGFTMGIDVNPDFVIARQTFDEAAQSNGLNTVHVYLENWADATGKNAVQADRIVDAAAGAGLYVIIAIGGGLSGNGHPGNGWFDIDKVRSFWTFYAPRYKDRTHVLFELQNNPENVCTAPLQPATIAMEREGYSLIRGLAPDTPVLLFSFRSMPDESTLADSIAQVTDVVDWSNAFVTTQADATCSPVTSYAAVIASARTQNVPMMVSSTPVEGWEPYGRELEAAKVSWIFARWITHVQNFTSLQAEVRAADITWCPDFGTFPESASMCTGKP